LATPIDVSGYLREYHDTGEILLRAKWTMDGAETLAEAADLLRQFADELDALAKAGFHLMGPIEDDYGFAHRGEEEERRVRRPQHLGSHDLNEDAATG
jgi:hypothetical protein